MVNNVLAGVRDVLLIILMLAAIAFGVRFLLVPGDAGSQWQPAPAPTADQPCERNAGMPGCGG